MCRHEYDWNIIECDINQLISLSLAHCLWNTNAQSKSKTGYFEDTKVTVNATRSLTFDVDWKVSLVEYACQIWSLYLLRLQSHDQG